MSLIVCLARATRTTNLARDGRDTHALDAQGLLDRIWSRMITRGPPCSFSSCITYLITSYKNNHTINNTVHLIIYMIGLLCSTKTPISRDGSLAFDMIPFLNVQTDQETCKAKMYAGVNA